MTGEPEWCPTCEAPATIVEVHDEQIGFEEQAREVRVTDLSCGHSTDVPLRIRYAP